jgi:polar amino acid transport system substrate-binding protein
MASVCSAQQKTIQLSKKCHLNIGIAEWQPLQYVDTNGEPQGLQVDFVRAIVKELDCSLSYTIGDWNKMVAGVENGTIDFVPDASMTEPRAKFGHFSIPYRNDSFAIYVRKDDQTKYLKSELTDLKKSKFKLAINNDVFYGEEIEAWQTDPEYKDTIVYSNNMRQSYDKLLAEEVDGFVEDPYVMAYQFRSKKIAKTLKPLPIRISSHQSCFMFSKKRISLDFVDRFNVALSKVKQQKGFQSSWFQL